MREVLSTKDKREAIKRYIALNPELSNRRIARYWDVNPTTIRRYRLQLDGALAPQNGQRAVLKHHPETENLPLVLPTHVEYDPGKIQDAMIVLMDKIVEMGKARTYLKDYLPFQIIDAIEGTTICSALDSFEDDLLETMQLYKELVNERNYRQNR